MQKKTSWYPEGRQAGYDTAFTSIPSGPILYLSCIWSLRSDLWVGWVFIGDS